MFKEKKKGTSTYHSANSIASGRGKGMVGVGCVHPAITGERNPIRDKEKGKTVIPPPPKKTPQKLKSVFDCLRICE